MLLKDNDIAEKDRTVCITGPKPEKLPDKGERRSQVVKVLKSFLYKAILDSAEEGYNCFVTGFTEGVELWAGEIILELKAQNKNVKLVIVSPYKEYTDRFRSEEKFLVGNITLKADRIVYISEKYSSGCMQKRNKYMVEHAGKLIAIVPDSNSGKGNIASLAERNGLITHIIDVHRLEEQLREEDLRAASAPVRRRRHILF